MITSSVLCKALVQPQVPHEFIALLWGHAGKVAAHGIVHLCEEVGDVEVDHGEVARFGHRLLLEQDTARLFEMFLLPNEIMDVSAPPIVHRLSHGEVALTPLHHPVEVLHGVDPGKVDGEVLVKDVKLEHLLEHAKHLDHLLGALLGLPGADLEEDVAAADVERVRLEDTESPRVVVHFYSLECYLLTVGG